MSKRINTFLIISGFHASEFKTSSSQYIHVRSAIFNTLFYKEETVVLIFIVLHHKFMTILWHQAFWVIVVYIGETVKDNLLILAFVEEMRKYPLADSERLKAFGILERAIGMKFIESMNFIFIS